MPLHAHHPSTPNETTIRLTDEELRPTSLAETARRLSRLAGRLGPRGLALDLADVPCLSGAAVSMLLVLHRKLRSAGGRLTLSGVRPLVHQVLAVTRLTRVLDVRREAPAA